METKQCKRCGEVKPLEAFGKRKASKDGLEPWCRACKAADAKARRDENPGKDRAQFLRWMTANLPKKVFNQYSQNAKRRGLAFTLTLEQVEAMLAPMTCSVTGLSLRLEHNGPSFANPWAPSIDRIDNARGYEPDNVRVVCWAYNCMRGDFPDAVLMTLAKALVTRA